MLQEKEAAAAAVKFKERPRRARKPLQSKL